MKTIKKYLLAISEIEAAEIGSLKGSDELGEEQKKALIHLSATISNEVSELRKVYNMFPNPEIEKLKRKIKASNKRIDKLKFPPIPPSTSR